MLNLLYSCPQVGDESRGTLATTAAASGATAAASVEEYVAEGKVAGVGEVADEARVLLFFNTVMKRLSRTVLQSGFYFERMFSFTSFTTKQDGGVSQMFCSSFLISTSLSRLLLQDVTNTLRASATRSRPTAPLRPPPSSAPTWFTTTTTATRSRCTRWMRSC